MNDTIRATAFLDKGGTGKTTAVAHLGVALAQADHNVLLIDFAGKQGDLAKAFGIWATYREGIKADNAWQNLTTAFQKEWSTIAEKLGDAAVQDMIYPTKEGVDLIPTHPGLDNLNSELGNIDDPLERYSRLNQFLDEYIDPLGYDIVLLDLPGLTNNVSYNGLWAARNVLVPVEMGPFEAEQAAQLRENLASIGETFAVDVELTMILPNKVDMRTSLAEEYLTAFEEEYSDEIAPAYIPYSQDIRNATEEGQTAFALAEPSKTAQQAREAFEMNANELTKRLEGRS